MKAGLGALTFLVMAAGFGPEVFGEYVQFVALAVILTPLVTAGFNWWVQPLGSEHGQAVVGSVTIVILLISSPIIAILAGTFAFAAQWPVLSVLVVCLAEGVIFPVWGYYILGLLPQDKNVSYVALTTALQLLKLGATVSVLATFGADLTMWGVVASFLGLTGLIFSIAYFRPASLREGATIARRWLRRGTNFGLVGSASGLSDNIDRLLLGTVLPSADVGTYGASSRTVAYGTLPVRSIALVVYPKYFQHAHQRDYDSLTSTMHKTIRLSLLPAIGAALIAILGAWVLEVAILPTYHDLFLATVILAGCIPLRAVQYAAGDVLYAVNHPFLRLFISLGGALLMAVTAILGGFHFGIIGTAYGVLLATAVTTCFNFIVVMRVLRKEKLSHE